MHDVTLSTFPRFNLAFNGVNKKNADLHRDKIRDETFITEFRGELTLCG